MPNRTQVVSVTRAVMAAETASHGGLSKAVAALTLKTGSVDAAKSAKAAPLKAAQWCSWEWLQTQVYAAASSRLSYV